MELTYNCRSCPICGSSNIEYSYKHCLKPIDGISILMEFSVVVCGDCGMTYADSVPNQETINLYYRKFSKYETGGAEPGNRDIRIADFVCAQSFKTSASIVDVGCGSGSLLRELKQRGYSTVTGVELSDINCNYLMESGIPIINKSLFDLTLHDIPEKFDCIILNTVLEHLSDLHTAIRILSSLMNDNGVMIITVPNLNFFNKNVRFPFEELSMEHINYFTLDSLELLMKLHGYKLKDYDNNYLQTFVFCMKDSPKASIHEYMARCCEYLAPTIQLINSYYESLKPIVIYGAGTFCQYLLANTQLANCNIVNIVDSNTNYYGHSLNSLVIQSPQTLLNKAYHNVDIITVSYRFNDEITASIRGMGLSNTIVNLPLSK
jgi:SAM-dependent methyltransferase